MLEHLLSCHLQCFTGRTSIFSLLIPLPLHAAVVDLSHSQKPSPKQYVSPLVFSFTEADILNAINAGLFLSNTKLSQQQSTSAATGQLTTTARGSTGPSASSSSVVGYLLPPAPTGYRGSITTGQSAQQIQLAQQQQQAAAAAAVAAAAAQLYGGSLDGFPNISSG